MKKVVLIFVIAINANLLSAQQTYTQMFDSLLFHIGKSDAVTGILYDRVIPFAYLTNFTLYSVSDTSDDNRMMCLKQKRQMEFVLKSLLKNKMCVFFNYSSKK